MRAAIGIVLIAAACIMLKRAIDRGFWTDTTYGDAAATVLIIIMSILTVEAGLILLHAFSLF